MSCRPRRESRRQPGVRNRRSTATGLLQVLASHCDWLAAELGTSCSRARLTDPASDNGAQLPPAWRSRATPPRTSLTGVGEGRGGGGRTRATASDRRTPLTSPTDPKEWSPAESNT